MPKTTSRERRSYRSLYTVLMHHPQWRGLSAPAQLALVMVKLELPFVAIGECDAHTIRKRCSLTLAAAEAALTELTCAGWVQREGDYIWLVNGLRHEPHMVAANPNHRIHAASLLNDLPPMLLVDAFRDYYPEWFPAHAAHIAVTGASSGQTPDSQPSDSNAEEPAIREGAVDHGIGDPIPQGMEHPNDHGITDHKNGHKNDDEDDHQNQNADNTVTHCSAPQRASGETSVASTLGKNVSPGHTASSAVGREASGAAHTATMSGQRTARERNERSGTSNSAPSDPSAYPTSFDAFWPARQRRAGDDPKHAAFHGVASASLAVGSSPMTMAAAPKKASRAAANDDYRTDAEFTALRTRYPKRSGAQNWPGAYEAYCKLVSNGQATAAALLLAATAYMVECANQDRIGTQYVCQASTFFNGRVLEYLPALDSNGAPVVPSPCAESADTWDCVI